MKFWETFFVVAVGAAAMVFLHSDYSPIDLRAAVAEAATIETVADVVSEVEDAGVCFRPVDCIAKAEVVGIAAHEGEPLMDTVLEGD